MHAILFTCNLLCITLYSILLNWYLTRQVALVGLASPSTNLWLAESRDLLQINFRLFSQFQFSGIVPLCYFVGFFSVLGISLYGMLSGLKLGFYSDFPRILTGKFDYYLGSSEHEPLFLGILCSCLLLIPPLSIFLGLSGSRTVALVFDNLGDEVAANLVDCNGANYWQLGNNSLYLLVTDFLSDNQDSFGGYNCGFMTIQPRFSGFWTSCGNGMTSTFDLGNFANYYQSFIDWADHAPFTNTWKTTYTGCLILLGLLVAGLVLFVGWAYFYRAKLIEYRRAQVEDQIQMVGNGQVGNEMSAQLAYIEIVNNPCETAAA